MVLPPPDGKRQWRERLAIHSADPRCAGCHAQMDPLGLAFEHYDGIGRYRDEDVGEPIDTAGVLTGVGGGDAPFNDAVELAQLLARAPEVRALLRHPRLPLRRTAARWTSSSWTAARSSAWPSASTTSGGRHARPGGRHHHRRELHLRAQ